MSARDKTGLGYSTQLNELSSNHETDSENSLSIFDGRSSNDEHLLKNDRFSKNGYKVVPPPITGNFLTPRADISFARPSINTAKPVSTVKPSISTAMPVYTARPSISTVRPVYALIHLPKNGQCKTKRLMVKNMTIAGKRAVVNTGKGKLDIDLKKSRWVWRSKGNYLDHVSKDSGSFMLKKVEYVDPKGISKFGHAVMDSGCSSHMTDNKAYLSDYEDFNGGFVGFGSDPKRDELKFNLFSFSQMCDKKNSVLFTKSECLILSPSFKLLDESQVVLRVPRKDDVYSLDLKNIIPSRGLEKKLNHNVKIIRCDNKIEFKNYAMNEFCAKKGIKREFSVARTPQQNGVAERKNRTLIEAARTMLADSL
ncbi:ribonuclease H-like domain-containing protein [Tanacetum coccineum]